jgi:hypothetical protein
MGEWLIPAVLKTVVPERVPGVRIPLPPPLSLPRTSQQVQDELLMVATAGEFDEFDLNEFFAAT